MQELGEGTETLGPLELPDDEEAGGLEALEEVEQVDREMLTPLEIVFIVYLSIVFLLACISNISILLAFFRKSSLRTTSNRFVIQLLVVNLLCCCMLLPLVLLETMFSGVPGQCSLSEGVCSWIASLSVLSTLLIGGDQYLAVKFPLRYRHHVTRTRACISQLCVCLLSSVIAGLGPLAPSPNSFWTSCTLSTDQPKLDVLSVVLGGSTVLLSFILPVLTLTVIYAKIFREAHNNSARTRRNSLNPSENLYNITSTLVAPLTIAGTDLKKARAPSIASSPRTRSEPSLERKGSFLYRSPSHIKANLSQFRHRISNASQQILQREEGRTARLYTLTLASILVCWSPYYLTFILRLLPWVPVLPPWTLQLVLSPCFLYPLISPFIFATRNQKIRKELKRVFQIRSSEEDVFGLPPPSARKVGRSISMKESRNRDILNARNKELMKSGRGVRRVGGEAAQSLLLVRSSRSSFSSTTTSSSTAAPTITTVLRYPRLEQTC